MNKGDIVTLVTISGEYVGKFISQDGQSIEVENPRMILSDPQTGNMGFAKGLAATGVENPKTAVFQQVVVCVLTNEQVSDAFLRATGEKTIEVPSSKIIGMPK
jgi:hypothetical protein|tara:strand:- start:966 stop:1274 length:309 start_codon:yes stop_codon:yes gene_type:complete